MALTRVTYKGLSDVRHMSKKDLNDAGVGVDGDLTFDRVGKARGGLLARPNRGVVFISDMSDELLALLKEEGTFTITEVDNESGQDVQDIVTATKADDTGNTVVDGTTGQQSTKPDKPKK